MKKKKKKRGIKNGGKEKLEILSRVVGSAASLSHVLQMGAVAFSLWGALAPARAAFQERQSAPQGSVGNCEWLGRARKTLGMSALQPGDWTLQGPEVNALAWGALLEGNMALILGELGHRYIRQA